MPCGTFCIFNLIQHTGYKEIRKSTSSCSAAPVHAHKCLPLQIGQQTCGSMTGLVHLTGEHLSSRQITLPPLNRKKPHHDHSSNKAWLHVSIKPRQTLKCVFFLFFFTYLKGRPQETAVILLGNSLFYFAFCVYPDTDLT